MTNEPKGECSVDSQGVADRLNEDWTDGPALVKVEICTNGWFRMADRWKIIPGNREKQVDTDTGKWFDVGGDTPRYTAEDIREKFPTAGA